MSQGGRRYNIQTQRTTCAMMTCDAGIAVMKPVNPLIREDKKTLQVMLTTSILSRVQNGPTSSTFF
jgi:hypothetical protein